MNFNINWDRWIKASVAKHFQNEILIDATTVFVEGFARNTEGKKDWVEVRMDGPYITELTRGQWRIEIEINIAICVNEQSNAYQIENLKGRVSKLFTNCLDIYKYGDSEEDDNTKLGCFNLKSQGKEKIITTNFGKVRPDTNQLQASVEGHFVMHL